MIKFLIKYMYFDDVRFEQEVEEENALAALAKAIYMHSLDDYETSRDWCGDRGFHIDITHIEHV